MDDVGWEVVGFFSPIEQRVTLCRRGALWSTGGSKPAYSQMKTPARVLVAAACTAVASSQTDPLHLSFCDPASPNQLFYYDPAHSYFILASSGLCMDVFYYGVR